MGGQVAKEQRGIDWAQINKMPLDERKIKLQALLVDYKQIHKDEPDPTNKIILGNIIQKIETKLDQTNRLLAVREKQLAAEASKASLVAAESEAVRKQVMRMPVKEQDYLCKFSAIGARELDNGRSLGPDEFTFKCKPYIKPPVKAAVAATPKKVTVVNKNGQLESFWVY